jgi:hypothetical protein
MAAAGRELNGDPDTVPAEFPGKQARRIYLSDAGFRTMPADGHGGIV